VEPLERKAIERKILLRREVSRRRIDDPLWNCKPHPKQKEFIDAVLSGSFEECWALYANRAGKSDAGAYCGSLFARFGKGQESSEVPIREEQGEKHKVGSSTSGWVVSLDFPASRDVIQPKYFDNGFVPPGATHPPFIPEREIDQWRKDDQILKLKNGSLIGFKSCDSGRIKFQGTEKDWIHFDEEPSESIYQECMIRVGQKPLNTFGTCTLLPPEGKVGGISWVFPKLVKPWQRGERKNIFIGQASIYDNPYIHEKEIRRLENIYLEGTVQRKIRLNGELLPGMSGARVYSSFNSQVNVAPQAEHFNEYRPLCWIWDFNVEPQTSLIGQRDPSGIFRVFRELVMEEGSIPDMCEWFRSEYSVHKAQVWIYGDATGRARSPQSQQSNYMIIQNIMMSYPVPVSLRVPEVNPSVPNRINSVNVSFRSETGEVKCLIDPSCLNLIDDFEQVISDGRGKIKKTYDRKDSYFRRTHTSDAYGYWISYESPILPFTEHMGDEEGDIPSPSYGFTKEYEDRSVYGRRFQRDELIIPWRR